MAGNDKVISLENTRRDGGARQVLICRLLARFKDMTATHMRRILQAMFDTADDALFKMAEHAEAGTDKNPYFDSMRIVRLQRTSIEQEFFARLDAKFTHYLEQDLHNKRTVSEKIDFDALELVSEDDLELTLASQRLVQKIQSLYAQDLSAINKRLACLFEQEEVDSTAIPFAAEFLVKAYTQASENTNIMLEVRLILLKLFDLSCVHGFAELYCDINQEFIEANVLPVIQPATRRNDSESTAVTHRTAIPSDVQLLPTAYVSPGAVMAKGDNLWSTLQGYLSQQRNRGGVLARAPAAGLVAGGMRGNGGGPQLAFTARELLGSLTALQLDAEGALPSVGAHAVGNFVRVHLQSDSDANNKPPRQLNPVDNDLIDVVCLIFDYILADRQLPEAAKASIRRLQIPMLKVAILDKQFFSSRGHPARDLLDLLAQSALGIDSSDEDDPILIKIDETVQRILDEFTDNVRLFGELKQEFDGFLQARRVHETELLTDLERRQHAREQLVLARTWVRETLAQHLLGRTLPAVVADIILGPWKDVMLHTYLSEGEDSILWKTQIRFIDVLAWSVESKEIRLDKVKLGNIVRQLIAALRTGLQRIEYPQAEIDAVFAALEPFHLASLHGQHYQQPPDAEARLNSAIANTEAEYANMQASDDLPCDDRMILEDIVLEGWEADPVLDAINDEYLELARHLEMGKWVEFLDQDGNQRHARLAWKSELLGEYTFLNWKFDVVTDKSLLELADDLRHGKARVVNDVPLMDRALSSVLTTLMPKST